MVTTWTRALTSAASILLFVTANGFAASKLPIPAGWLKSRFPQVELGDCSIPIRAGQPSGFTTAKPLHAGRITLLTGADATLTVQGTDRRGHAWNITLRNQPGGCTAWRADLDQNSEDDLIMTTFSPTSDGKDVTLTIIMVDDLGRPVPWQAPGYFEVDEHGVRELLNLNQDGRAQLAYQHVEGDQFEGRRSSLSLYKALDAHWQRMSGPFAGLFLPIIRPVGSKLTDSDLSNTIDNRAVLLKIARLNRGVNGDCGVQLPFYRESDGNPRVDTEASERVGKFCFDTIVLSNGMTARLPDMVVVDGALGRDVALGDTSRLIGEVIEHGLSVRVVGRFCESDCRPFLLWAIEGKQ